MGVDQTVFKASFISVERKFSVSDPQHEVDTSIYDSIKVTV